MNKIYDDAKDLHVRGVYIYGADEDTKAYVDPECTVQIKTSELKEAFLKGAVTIIDGVYYKPLTLSISSGVGSVTYLSSNGMITLVSIAD